MYSAELIDHFENPRNAGEVPDADAQVRVENPACGDILELSVKVEENRIADVRFRAKGCVPAMACASAVTMLAKGKPLAEALEIGRKDVTRAVGGVPPSSGHAAQLAVDALKEMLKRLS